ncbi:MAG: SDR family NAD(P)-dependent oxidoreductase [Clostridia bacterium]|nr:SDR family NAD(P)-dependent oxidoreductase [Clostridia bacterium]
MDIEKWLKNNTKDLQGKVVVMTGAAGGLGSITSRYLVQANAKLIMLERDVAKMDAVSNQLRAEFPNAEIETIRIDLNSLASINEVAAQLVDQRIDYLILNAGVYDIPLVKSELGYNNVFTINFIGQYHLIRKLLPALQRTKGKVIPVSSISMDYGRFNENDVDYSNEPKSTKVYGNSKRVFTLALSEMFKDRDDVRLAIVHPGVTLTPMTNAQNKAFTNFTMKLIFPKPTKAALSIVAGVFQDIEYDEWIGPKVKNIWGAPNVKKLPESTAEERAKIANLAESICKEIDDFESHKHD